MIIEQLRYFTAPSDRAQVLEIRREIGRIRSDHGVPPGHLLIPDGEDGPSLVWQCGYQSEAEMGSAETQLLGNEAYEEARSRLGALSTRVEFEVYMADGSEE